MRPVILSILFLGLVLGQATATVVGAAPPAKGKAASAEILPVDVNKADAKQLAELPGIGPALAKRIVDFRKQHGPFKRVEDVIKVRGIGEKSFERIRPYLKVGK